LIRQKPGSYDPDKDSPLIGGHGEEKKWFTVIFDGRDIPQAEGDGGGAHCIKTCDIITLLEQAAEEFPEKEVFDYNPTIYYYDPDKVDAWKKKWLTVPPV